MDSLTALETALNTALDSTGITLTFPRVERFTKPADLVRVSPMRLVLKDTPVGKQALGPLLNLSRAQREQLFDQLAAAICEGAGALLVGDIGVSILSGTGFLAVEFGGAEATTGNLVLESPFTDPVAPTGPTPNLPGPVLPSTFPVLPGPVTAPIGSAPSRPVASIGPLEDHCESVNPLRHTACSKGALLVVGLAGLLATAGVGAADLRHQRRRRARAAEVSA